MEGEGKGSLLGGQWKVKEKVLFLVANGRWRKNPFHLFPLSPQPILPKPSIFPFDLKVLLYHGYRLLFANPPFSLAYKSWSCTLMSQVPPTFITNSILLKIFLLSFEIMASRMVTSYGPQAAQMNEEPTSESSLDLTLTQHPRDEDPASQEVCARLKSRSPSSLVLSHFSKLSHPGDFVTSRPCFRWQTWNSMWRLLWDRRHFHLRLVFSCWRWTLSLVARSNSSTAS